MNATGKVLCQVAVATDEAALQRLVACAKTRQATVAVDQCVTAALRAQRVRRPEALAKQLHEAALAQTVTITGSQTAARLVTELAAQLAAVLARRDKGEARVMARPLLPRGQPGRARPRPKLWRHAMPEQRDERRSESERVDAAETATGATAGTIGGTPGDPTGGSPGGASAGTTDAPGIAPGVRTGVPTASGGGVTDEKGAAPH